MSFSQTSYVQLRGRFGSVSRRNMSGQNGEVFQDFDCMLIFVDGKSDKFYCIQLLKNGKGFHVWTRWGRNGTVGQTKLEGPLSQADAEKSYKKKFFDKTKNEWGKLFSPVKGKYTLVEKTSAPQNKALEKPEFPNESGVQLPADVLCAILSFLSTRDVLRCMQVCKSWKALLAEKHFWKTSIQNRFDLRIKSDVSGEGPFGQWSNPIVEECFCHVDDEHDAYVIRPFPSMWICGVVHPLGLNPMSGDVRSLQSFSRSLEILTHMRNESSRLHILSGNECSSSEGTDEIFAVIFPWEKEELPMASDIITKVFHFHPEICESVDSELQCEKLYFHVKADYTENEDDEGDKNHDLNEKPCLNTIFGTHCNEPWKYKATREFLQWLQPIMVPSLTVYAGADILNPVVVFMVTNLAPGWVGGALTAVIYT